MASPDDRGVPRFLGCRRAVVRDYLSPMVKEGVLAYTVPEMENHPEQRYTLPAEPPAP